jgi:hypothetical protein
MDTRSQPEYILAAILNGIRRWIKLMLQVTIITVSVASQVTSLIVSAKKK